jgi:RNA polymerase sigma-70 factor (ECF subfamily)
VPQDHDSSSAPAQFFPAAYNELRRLAGAYMRNERRDHTLQPTALVHEAYLRLVGNTRMEFRNKSHFFAMAARQMRRILVDHARRHRSNRRGGGHERITLDEAVAITPESTVDVLALDKALEKLARLDRRQGDIAELRLFGGLTEQELAGNFNFSERTIRDDWRVAKAWLRRELSQRDPTPRERL